MRHSHRLPQLEMPMNRGLAAHGREDRIRISHKTPISRIKRRLLRH